MNIPERTVERLSEYRRTLLTYLAQGKTHIYSHELAQLLNITAVQVRRDLMLIGYSSIKKQGYNAEELIDVIGDIIDHTSGLNVAVIGMGNMGKAVTAYFAGKRVKLNVVSTFDVDKAKVGNEFFGVRCHHIDELKQKVEEKKISIAIIASPPSTAVQVAEVTVLAGIKGILNLTTVPLTVPDNVFLEEYDMITSMEKLAYFVKTIEG